MHKHTTLPNLMQKIVSDEDRILLVNSEQNNVVPKSAIAS
ncbi:hypothetical protein BRO54_3400 [Geobacillus proteiniphilus]|uniref:Uncharacterized protein n=2 Tax=Geobacillus TaxID=129337 RepID=A0A1Q5SMH9_9BACL|nr:hypothetical protein T260_05580 [Geobacillus sp. MAS1]OKO89182.1 hypothetical protein BRO54_3400 [Geobacillus proteiniphilus]